MSQEKARAHTNQAKRRADQAKRRAEDALAAYHAAIADEYRAGARPRDLVASTGYTREQIRRILRAAGIEKDDKPGTG